jgi:hypothetical protein
VHPQSRFDVSENATGVEEPAETVIPVFVCERYPLAVAVTSYVPAVKLAIVHCPEASVVQECSDGPDAETTAPLIGWPEAASVTVAEIEPGFAAVVVEEPIKTQPPPEHV